MNLPNGPARDTARFYDAVADEFEADYYSTNADPVIRHDVAAFESLVREELRAKSIGRAVELGCGSGHWLEWLRRIAIPAVGIDISRRMCLVAAERSLPAVQAELASLPIRSSSADLVFAPYCALDHCEHYAQAFAEIDRIATTDATVIIMVDNAERHIKRYWQVSLSRVRSLGSDPRRGIWLHEVDGSQVAVFTKMFAAAELEALLPGWSLRVHGLGLLGPAIPHWLRSRRGRVTRALLYVLAPIERFLARPLRRHAALLVAVGTRRPTPID